MQLGLAWQVQRWWPKALINGSEMENFADCKRLPVLRGQQRGAHFLKVIWEQNVIVVKEHKVLSCGFFSHHFLPDVRTVASMVDTRNAIATLDDLAAAGLRAGDERARHEVDVAELLGDSVEAWRVPAAAHGAALAFEWTGVPARVWGERLRLAQATGNLIANAIEHGGGDISVRGSLAPEHRRVRIEVVDAGPGLPAPVADLARRPRGGRGTRGRGLAIAATVARDHGGRLAAAPCETRRAARARAPRRGLNPPRQRCGVPRIAAQNSLCRHQRRAGSRTAGT